MVYAGFVYSGSSSSTIGVAPDHDAGEYIQAGRNYALGKNESFLFDVPAGLANTADANGVPLAAGTHLGFFPAAYTVASLPLTATDIAAISSLGAVTTGAVTYIDVAQEITNGVFSVRTSGTGYTVSGEPGFLRTSATAYEHDNEVEVALSGETLDRRTQAVWVSADKFRYVGTVDPGNRFEVAS